MHIYIIYVPVGSKESMHVQLDGSSFSIESDYYYQ